MDDERTPPGDLPQDLPRDLPSAEELGVSEAEYERILRDVRRQRGP